MCFMLQLGYVGNMPGNFFIFILKLFRLEYHNYCYSELEKPEETLFSMLTGKVHSLPGHIQAAYVQNIMKVLAIILCKGDNQQSIKV